VVKISTVKPGSAKGVEIFNSRSGGYKGSPPSTQARKFIEGQLEVSSALYFLFFDTRSYFAGDAP